MESFYPCPLILNRCGILNQDFLSRKENREVPQTKEISSTSISLLRGPRWEKQISVKFTTICTKRRRKIWSHHLNKIQIFLFARGKSFKDLSENGW